MAVVGVGHAAAAIIDGDGQVIERYRYDAFGPVTVLAPDFSVRATSECGWNFLYHAEFIDALTGLYNYGYRYYHPDLGRWISRDPIEEEGGLNLYGFVGNDGVDRWDIWGESPYDDRPLPPGLAPIPPGAVDGIADSIAGIVERLILSCVQVETFDPGPIGD